MTMTTDERTDDEIHKAFLPTWEDLKTESEYPERRPLLAHYTSIPTLERMMSNDEVWFSNPLYMNDMEELRFGITEGASAFRRNLLLKLNCSDNSYNALLAAFDRCLEEFTEKHAFDTYVFCMSEHTDDATDGLLSMWRGYGGNGSGAAIVFDTAKFDFDPDANFLLLSNVHYLSQNKRRAWIEAKLSELATLLEKNPIPDNKLYIPVHIFFQRLKMFSLFTKHDGFSEEKEWRAVYLRDWDKKNVLEEMLHYALGHNGIEPKLKLKIKPIAGLTMNDFSLDRIATQIILGPSISKDISVMAVRRMLESNKKLELATNLSASSTPFRGSKPFSM